MEAVVDARLPLGEDGDLAEEKQPPPYAEQNHSVNLLLKQEREEYLQELASGEHVDFVDRECLPREETDSATLLGENFQRELKIQREKLAQAGLPEERIDELLDVVKSFPTVFNGDLSLGSGLRSY